MVEIGILFNKTLSNQYNVLPIKVKIALMTEANMTTTPMIRFNIQIPRKSKRVRSLFTK